MEIGRLSLEILDGKLYGHCLNEGVFNLFFNGIFIPH